MTYPPNIRQLHETTLDLQVQINDLHEKLNDCCQDLDQKIRYALDAIKRLNNELDNYCNLCIEFNSRLAALQTICDDLRRIVQHDR